MGKKYIMVGGKKRYIEEKKSSNDKLDDKAKKIAKDITANLGLDNLGDVKNLKKSVDKLIEQTDPCDSKLKAILNGKSIRNKDELTKEEKIVGFFHAVVTNNHLAAKALSEGTAADGGYLFPDEFRAELIRELADITVARKVCRVIPMKRDVMKLPGVESGPVGVWTQENKIKSTTTAHFTEHTLTAFKLAAILYSSDELIADSTEFNVVKLIISLFAEEFADREDEAFAQGNGTTAPTGLVTARAGGTIATVTCNGNLDFDDIINLEYALPTKYRTKAIFLAHGTNIKELKKVKDDNGQYLWQPRVTDKEVDRYNGYPVVELNWLPESEIFFGDFKRGYYIGDRQRMTVLLSQHTTQAFNYDMTAIRVVERIAGNVIQAQAIRSLITIP